LNVIKLHELKVNGWMLWNQLGTLYTGWILLEWMMQYEYFCDEFPHGKFQLTVHQWMWEHLMNKCHANREDKSIMFKTNSTLWNLLDECDFTIWNSVAENM
jgi:hypothetical protein